MLGALHDIRSAALDPAMKPPSLALLLASWLYDANAMGVLAGAQSDGLNAPSLRFVRTRRYSDTYFLGRGEGGDGIPEATIWAIESAINRFVLIARKLEEGADAGCCDVSDQDVSEIDACGAIDTQLFEAVAVQAPCAAHPADEHAAAPNRAGEWDVRRSIGESIERFQLPVRFMVEYRVDVRCGKVAFEVIVPPAQLMPQRMYSSQAGSWVDQSDAERGRMALRYAEHVGMMLAAAAFHAGCAIDEVAVCARELEAASEVGPEGSEPGGESHGDGAGVDTGFGTGFGGEDGGFDAEGDEFDGGSVIVELEDGSVIVESGGNDSGSADAGSCDAHPLPGETPEASARAPVSKRRLRRSTRSCSRNAARFSAPTRSISRSMTPSMPNRSAFEASCPRWARSPSVRAR